MTLESVVLLTQTVTMLIASLLLAYTVARYSTNVAHTEGMVSLAAGFFMLSVAWAVLMFTDANLVYRALVLVAALCGFVGVAYFAEPFIDLTGEDEFGAPPEPPAEEDGDEGEGFGDAVRS